MSKAQDPQSCIRAWQTANYNTLQKGQWWKCAQVLLMHKENLEQTVTTSRRRGEIYLKMDMGRGGGPAKKNVKGRKPVFQSLNDKKPKQNPTIF